MTFQFFPPCNATVSRSMLSCSIDHLPRFFSSENVAPVVGVGVIEGMEFEDGNKELALDAPGPTPLPPPPICAADAAAAMFIKVMPPFAIMKAIIACCCSGVAAESGVEPNPTPLLSAFVAVRVCWSSSSASSSLSSSSNCCWFGRVCEEAGLATSEPDDESGSDGRESETPDETGGAFIVADSVDACV